MGGSGRYLSSFHLFFLCSQNMVAVVQDNEEFAFGICHWLLMPMSFISQLNPAVKLKKGADKHLCGVHGKNDIS